MGENVCKPYILRLKGLTSKMLKELTYAITNKQTKTNKKTI
jgi:hypothetical protein